MTHYLDPTLLGIVPPMDLGFGAEEGVSPFPLKLRTHDNSRMKVGSVGLFGARRDLDSTSDLIRLHEGVDLLAPICTPVFAVQDGTVVQATPDSVLFEHAKGFRYLTFYTHLQNVTVSTGAQLHQGQRFGEVGDFPTKNDHLHFEIRYPFERTSMDRTNSLPIDPTWALYAWEIRRYRNDASTRHVVSADRIIEFNEVVRGRLLRFARLRVAGFDRNIYLPLGPMDEGDRSLLETIRGAFFHRSAVEITWRECLFFNQIEFSFDQDDKIPVIAEMRVLAT